jgi:hypothetical protein
MGSLVQAQYFECCVKAHGQCRQSPKKMKWRQCSGGVAGRCRVLACHATPPGSSCRRRRAPVHISALHLDVFCPQTPALSFIMVMRLSVTAAISHSLLPYIDRWTAYQLRRNEPIDDVKLKVWTVDESASRVMKAWTHSPPAFPQRRASC